MTRAALGWSCLLVVLAAVLAIGLAQPSAAQLAQTSSIDQLRQQQQQLEQQQQQLEQQQQQLQKLESEAAAELGGLEDKIQVTSAQIARNEAELKRAADRLRQLEAELAAAEASYQARQFSTVARLRFLQRQQGSHGWAVLLQSQNLNEFLDRRRQLALVYQADRQILAQLQAQAADLNRRYADVAQQRNQVALLTQQLQAQRAEFQAQADTQTALIDRLQKDRRASEAAETQLERDSFNIANLIRQRLMAAQQRDRIQGTGQLSYPSDGVITSGFGMRVHPILGYRRFHAGIDFGGAHGSSIRAANDGTVIFAGWYGGFGKAIIIDHGGSLTTLYAHTSEVYVTEGQTVQRGQPIAAVGSTGFSTGPHLHFEVRQNGNPVNPANFL